MVGPAQFIINMEYNLHARDLSVTKLPTSSSNKPCIVWIGKLILYCHCFVYTGHTDNLFTHAVLFFFVSDNYTLHINNCSMGPKASEIYNLLPVTSLQNYPYGSIAKKISFKAEILPPWIDLSWGDPLIIAGIVESGRSDLSVDLFICFIVLISLKGRCGGK